MARPGDMIENPVTGERMTFLKTHADTGGELLRVELRVRPRGFVVAEHVHSVQEERFDLREGSLTFKLNGATRRAGPGERVVIPAGSRHSWWNAEDTGGPATYESEAIESTASWSKLGMPRAFVFPSRARPKSVSRIVSVFSAG